MQRRVAIERDTKVRYTEMKCKRCYGPILVDRCTCCGAKVDTVAKPKKQLARPTIEKKDPRVTRIGNSNNWSVELNGEEIVFNSFEAAVRFADDNGIFVYD